MRPGRLRLSRAPLRHLAAQEPGPVGLDEARREVARRGCRSSIAARPALRRGRPTAGRPRGGRRSRGHERQSRSPRPHDDSLNACPHVAHRNPERDPARRCAAPLRLLEKTGLLTASAAGREALSGSRRGVVVHAVSGRLQGDDAVIDLFGWAEGPADLRARGEGRGSRTWPHGRGPDRGGRCARAAAFHRMNELFTSDRLVFQWRSRPPEEARLHVGPAGMERAAPAGRAARRARARGQRRGASRPRSLRMLFDADRGRVPREARAAPAALRAQVHGRFGGAAAEVDGRFRRTSGAAPSFRRGRHCTIEVRGARAARDRLPSPFAPGSGGRPPARAPPSPSWGCARATTSVVRPCEPGR